MYVIIIAENQAIDILVIVTSEFQAPTSSFYIQHRTPTLLYGVSLTLLVSTRQITHQRAANLCFFSLGVLWTRIISTLEPQWIAAILSPRLVYKGTNPLQVASVEISFAT